jgi:hypothetical protein
VVLNHEDIREGGHPDKSITGNGMTSWLEFKHATPQFESVEQQRLTCHRLSHQGFCRYVIWWEDKKGQNKKTFIVHPSKLSSSDLITDAEEWTDGFDMQWLCEYVRRIHS